MTSGSSMQAMILTGPPQAGQVSRSMPKTRLSRWAQLIEARRSAGVRSSACSFEVRWLPFPRLAGVTRARYWLLGANTPWKRVRFRVETADYSAIPPRKQSHNAHSSQKTVTVKYPYHPLCGQTLEVMGRRTQNSEPHFLVTVSDASRQLLPAWMTEDAAAYCLTVASPVLPIDSLLHLHAFLKPLILSFSDPTKSSDRGDFDGRKTPTAP